MCDILITQPFFPIGAALVESITNAVYEALMSPVMSNLRGLPQLREWTAAAPGAAGGVVTGAGAQVFAGFKGH